MANKETPLQLVEFIAGADPRAGCWDADDFKGFALECIARARAVTRKPRVDINKLLRERPVSSRYGAPMGARNRYDAPPGGKRYCQRVRFVDGDYSADGTYWGGGREAAPLYAVFTLDLETLAFYRAWNRDDATKQHWKATGEAV